MSKIRCKINRSDWTWSTIWITEHYLRIEFVRQLKFSESLFCYWTVFILGSFEWTHIPSTHMTTDTHAERYNIALQSRSSCEETFETESCRYIYCHYDPDYHCHSSDKSPMSMSAPSLHDYILDSADDIHFISCSYQDFMDSGMM